MANNKPYFGVGNCEYKTIDISTESGLRKAEKMHTSGDWFINSQGMFTIQFYRQKRRCLAKRPREITER